MPQQLNYFEALQFAEYCYTVEEFLQEYGSAIRWQNSMIDTGELMNFIENIICDGL